MTQVNAQSFIKGNGWTARKVGTTYIVSLNDKTSILEDLTDFVKSEKITAGSIVGIGAINEATLRFFDPTTKNYVDKKFSEQMEVSNITGNISEVLDKPMLHLHVTLGRSDYSALAGHLLDGKIRGAGELYVYPVDSKIIKVKNENVGLNFYDFEK
ncbi:DNA-binding protein [Rhizosphaericola mali]|uniref:DNA-binding protein n=2 Tax=Rhizosphaericola mali TaxID=2545455 RepID=A0A5P2GB64_9BACT|nr:DNA-binding protein [Rhizosphaericola mali]